MSTATKRCTGCQLVKPLSAFHRKYGTKDGRRARCKQCRTKRNGKPPKISGAKTSAEYNRQWRAMHPDRNRATARRAELKRKYGITPEVYDELLAAQHGVCAVCKQPEVCTHAGRPKRLAVDHDHATGIIRGLLCTCCNRAIGLTGDNPNRLRELAAYLECRADVISAGS